MRLIRDFSSEGANGAVIALGNFEGLHAGHLAILRETKRLAQQQHALAAVLTFSPHPREFFSSTGEKLAIYPPEIKLQLMQQEGMEVVWLAQFDAKLAATSAEDFVERILHQSLGARHIVTGANFAFGKGRKGNAEFLAQALAARGIGYTAVPDVTSDAGVISSSTIRMALAEGDMAKAEKLLGRPYRLYGPIIHGDKRGRELGFPTANMALGELFLPRFGIYAARAKFDDSRGYEAVANLGIRPMFASAQPLLETHCFDSPGEVYATQAEVELVKFLRAEAHFESLDLLKVQMAKDCEQAKAALE